MILMETFVSLGRRPAAALVAFFLTACGPLTPGVDVPALSGGIQVNEPDHEVWTAALRQNGFDSLQVTLYARQLAWDSAEMIVPEDVSGVISEIRAAKRAGLRVTLVLRTALEQGLPLNRHYWHGMIWPEQAAIGNWFDRYRGFALEGARLAAREDVDLLAIGSELNSMTSTVPLDALPDLYAYFLDPARTAAVRERLVECATDVPVEALQPELRFVDGGGYDTLDAYLRAQEQADRAWTRHVTAATDSGANLERLNERRRRYDREWRELIGQVRAVYGGPLSYAANFDQVEQVGFWDALDAVGVNAYFPLSRWGLTAERLESELTARWLQVADGLNRLAARHGGPARVLPVILFELGWTRKAGSTVRPFSYRRVEALETADDDGGTSLTCIHWATQPEDPFERVAALGALNTVVAQGGFPTLRGFTLWKLSTDPAHRSLEPFVVVLPRANPRPAIEDDSDRADRAYLEIAADLATRLRRSAGNRE